jgi:hypothetical protein
LDGVASEKLEFSIKLVFFLSNRLSSAKHDKYQDDLRTMLLPYGIVTQMSKIINKEDGEYMGQLSKKVFVKSHEHGQL